MRLIFTLTILCLFTSYAHTQPLFTLLSEKKSGVDFVNEVKDEKSRNILIYSNYYGGAGVGVGDFNKDGLPDLFFAGNLSSDELYINEGDLQFRNITQKAGIEDNGGWSSGVVIADINNDSWPDIYVTRELYDDDLELRRNKLYINNRDLTFTEASTLYNLDNSERTRHATFFDYDEDGDLDAFLLNQPPNPGNYSKHLGEDLMQEKYSPRLMRNEGIDKPFTDVTEEAGVLRPGYPNSVVTADFNKDGWQDIYVANDFEAPDFLYMNNGDGTFKEVMKESFGHTSFYSMGVDVADINNDAWLDVMVLDMVAEDNFRLKANMSGMDPSAFWKVVENGGHYQYMYNSLQLNRGTGNFSDIAQIAGVSSTDWSWANLIADFDNDGLKDIFVTNGLYRDIRNSDASKTFPKYVTQKINEYIIANPNDPNVTILDILDLEEALSLLPSEKLSNYTFKNKGNLQFEKVSKDWGLDAKTFSNGATYADLDLDGDLDLVVSNVNERAYIYQNKSEQLSKNNFFRVQLKDGKNEFLFGTGLEIETSQGKQYVELTNVRGIYSTCENIAHFGLGKSQKVDKLKVYWNDGSITEKTNLSVNQLILIDKSEENVLSYQPPKKQPFFKNETEARQINFTHKENEFDDFEKQVLLPHKMSQFGPALAVSDVNNDGLEDFFVGGATSQNGKVYLQNNDGTFSYRDIFPLTDKICEDVDAIFLDADQDGDQDLYVASGGNAHSENNGIYQDRLYLNDGQGNFKRNSQALPKFMISSGKVLAKDFDGDGDEDLFVSGRHKPHQYPEPVSSYLLQNNGGIFEDVTDVKAPELRDIGMVTSAVWVDLDGDVTEELVIAGEWMPLTVFELKEGKFVKKNDTNGLEKYTGWWFSLSKADLDGDGDQDLIAGNLGLNYKYHTSPEKPFDVYYYDFDGNGSKDVVLGYYNQGKHFPLRGRSCSSQQVPELKKKFETYNLFAAAELEEVYEKDKLKNALHYKVNTFASAAFENDGNGNFTIHELPADAQISNINDFIIEDIDENGLPDILLAGNLYVSEVETPRNDAGIGLLLQNKGDWKFESIEPLKSGILIPSDVKKLRRISIDTRTGVLIGSNNNTIQLLISNNTKSNNTK